MGLPQLIHFDGGRVSGVPRSIHTRQPLQRTGILTGSLLFLAQDRSIVTAVTFDEAILRSRCWLQPAASRVKMEAWLVPSPRSRLHY